MNASEWMEKHAVVVPDDAVIFVRHPRHFLVKIDELGWVRYNPDDIADVISSHTRWRDAKIGRVKADPNRLAETAVSLRNLLQPGDARDRFLKSFAGVLAIPESGAMRYLSEIIFGTGRFKDAKQVLLKVQGGNSWFIWNIKGEVL